MSEEKVDYEKVIIQISQYLNDRGLDMMNISNDLRNLVAKERQRATVDNKKEEEKVEEKK